MICFKLNIKNLALNSSQPTTIKKSSKKPKKILTLRKKEMYICTLKTRPVFEKKFL
jgi:hypothetical protein